MEAMTDGVHPPDEEKIFQTAAALQGKERENYLRFACEGDPEMRFGVELLLAAIGDVSFMARGADDPASELGSTEFERLKLEEAGDRIGPYRLLQQIGEGGFGVVWIAEQEKPVRRQAALKIIKLGMDTKEVIVRFEQERQALAMMDHPNIAKVFDAGATPTGRPYFVMEMVQGVSITSYCDQNQLSMRDRLRLFIQVCSAVQHAHQKGIIHRDLKPTNILVSLHDDVPVPKVIDFGVAKATQGKVTDITILTKLECMVGTPLYMSPEQAEMKGGDVDTRSDIYSLGVLLYELLTGRTPLDRQDLVKAGAWEIRRVITEGDPKKPSTALISMEAGRRTAVARQRRSDIGRLISSIRGDLDWIVMKALERDRNRRYDTASGFGKDVERHLANEPVLARPPSVAYKFDRFFRRNKAAVRSGVAVLLALVAGVVGVFVQAVQTGREARRANLALDDLRASAPAFAEQAETLAQQERFSEAVEKLHYAAKLRPDVAEYLVKQGDLFECQFRLAEAVDAYRAALLLDPANARAISNSNLCQELLAVSTPGKPLSRESLTKLLDAMQREQRPAAQLLPIARRLGAEKALLLSVWSERLKTLSIPPEMPLKSRLRMADDGLLTLDLSRTKIADLSLLRGMPLAELDCTGCGNLTDLTALGELPLRNLNVSGTGVHDLAPLAAVRTLRILDLSGSQVTGLQALSGLQLRVLKLNRLAVYDLAPLRGMPLQQLAIDRTAVRELSPLVGLPLNWLSCDSIPAIHFEALAGLSLEFLSLRNTRCYDLAFLRRMPLRELFLTGCFASNSMVLSELHTLEVLALPERFRSVPELGIPALRNHLQLRQLGFESAEEPQANALPSAVEFWRTWDRERAVVEAFRAAGVEVSIKLLPDQSWEVSLDNQPVTDLSPLRGSPVVRLFARNTHIGNVQGIAGMSLKALSIKGTKVSDLSPLSGMPLEELELIGTAVTDLRPLQGMPLERLSVEETAISDLGPLKGMALREFWAGTTQVTDLSPLKGMPLRVLHIDDCRRLTDVSPLLEVPTLEQVFLPKTARNVELLRGLPNLEFISFEFDSRRNQPLHSSAEFWSMTSPVNEQGLGVEKNFAELELLIHSRIERHRSTEVGKDFLKLATIALATGNRARYRELCAEMQRRPPGVDSEWIIKAGCWPTEPGISQDEMRKSLNDLKSAYGDAPGLSTSFAITYALCELRMGLWDQVVKRIGLVPSHKNHREAAVCHALLALARFRLGDLGEARTHLDQARTLREKGWPTLGSSVPARTNVGPWHESLLLDLLVRDAETIITGPAGAAE
jgi:serine/threonine protein kinase